MTLPFAIKQRSGHLVLNSNDASSLKTLVQQIENFANQLKEGDNFQMRLEMAFSESLFPSRGPKDNIIGLDTEAIKNLFRAYSSSLGMKTRELAKHLGISHGTMYNMMSGKNGVHRQTARQIIYHAPTPELKVEAQRLFADASTDKENED